ncbi:MAG: hypothetical protein M1836_006118 [Candelina mexicana]|nr:MAG: hypothetical protein M1836_006118 [Candelina mexicana]
MYALKVPLDEVLPYHGVWTSTTRAADNANLYYDFAALVKPFLRDPSDYKQEVVTELFVEYVEERCSAFVERKEYKIVLAKATVLLFVRTIADGEQDRVNSQSVELLRLITQRTRASAGEVYLHPSTLAEGAQQKRPERGHQRPNSKPFLSYRSVYSFAERVRGKGVEEFWANGGEKPTRRSGPVKKIGDRALHSAEDIAREHARIDGILAEKKRKERKEQLDREEIAREHAAKKSRANTATASKLSQGIPTSDVAQPAKHVDVANTPRVIKKARAPISRSSTRPPITALQAPAPAQAPAQPPAPAPALASASAPAQPAAPAQAPAAVTPATPAAIPTPVTPALPTPPSTPSAPTPPSLPAAAARPLAQPPRTFTPNQALLNAVARRATAANNVSNDGKMKTITKTLDLSGYASVNIKVLPNHDWEMRFVRADDERKKTYSGTLSFDGFAPVTMSALEEGRWEVTLFDEEDL